MINFKNILAVTALFLAFPSASVALEIIAADQTTSWAHPNGVRSFSRTYDVNSFYEEVSLFFDTEDGYYAGNKHVELFLDDNLILDWGGSTYLNPAPNIVAFGSMGYKLYGDVAIEQSLWESITADKQLTVSWNQYFVGDPWNTGNYVAFELNGNISTAPVPEPSTFLLFGCGLSGLLFFIRKLKT